jgi:uncharacterized damage-inducible protein DinB
MYTRESLTDMHTRGHVSLRKLVAHCRALDAEQLDREIDGFGYPTVRLQLHHVIGCEEYWVGVLEGRVEADENDAAYPTIDALEAYRLRVATATGAYLRNASPDELNTARAMLTWGNRERVLVPAHVLVRTVTHVYQHQGQITGMCRLMGKPVSPGLDFPID